MNLKVHPDRCLSTSSAHSSAIPSNDRTRDSAATTLVSQRVVIVPYDLTVLNTALVSGNWKRYRTDQTSNFT